MMNDRNGIVYHYRWLKEGGDVCIPHVIIDYTEEYTELSGGYSSYAIAECPKFSPSSLDFFFGKNDRIVLIDNIDDFIRLADKTVCEGWHICQHSRGLFSPTELGDIE